MHNFQRVLRIALVLTATARVSLSTVCPSFVGMTPLMKAAEKADIEKMRTLMADGADVNALYGCDQPHAGRPVLRFAIDSHSVEAVALLIDAGADLDWMTTSPLILGKQHPANTRNLSLLSHAIRTKAPVEIIRLLLASGVSVDGTSTVHSNWTALMVAAYTGYTDAVVVLLKAGADKHAVNGMDGKTAHQYAREQKHQDIVRLLEDA